MTAGTLRTPWFLRLARRYVRRRLARSLDGLHAAGVERARRAARERPLILAANHVGWWDSFLVVALDEALGTEGFALMDAANLAGLPFFARLGAIPLDRESASRSRGGLRAAARLLDGPGRAVWMFPQGRHRPAHLRPLRFLPGVRLLARLAPGAAVVPIAFQYAFREGERPAAYASLGVPLPAREVAGEGGTERLEAAVRVELERIDAALAEATPPLPTLIAPRGRGSDEGVGARLLAAWRARTPGEARG